MVNRVFSFPFNSKPIYAADGITIADYDIKWDAEDFALAQKIQLGDGVFNTPSNNFQVLALGTSLAITGGFNSATDYNTAMIKGHTFAQLGNAEVVLVPHTTYPRIFTVTLRLSTLSEDRNITLNVNSGTAASNPQAPALIRNADQWEIQLAQVYVKAKATTIAQSDITDTRPNKTLCGYCISPGVNVDTTTIFNQYQDYLNQKIAEWNAAKAQQQTDWNAQMTAQQTAWNTQLTNQQTTWQNWFNGAQTNLALAAQFNFENLPALPGHTISITKATGGLSVNQIMRQTANNRLRATLFVTKSSDGKTIKSEETVYQDNGSTVQRYSVVTVNKNSDGSMTITTTS